MFAPKYFCVLDNKTGVIKTAHGFTFSKEEIFNRITSDLTDRYSDFNQSGFRVPGQSGALLIVSYIKFVDKTYHLAPDATPDREYALYSAILFALDSSYHYDGFYAGGFRSGHRWDVKCLFSA